MALKILYTAHAAASGGRNGHTQSSDGVVSVDLSVPKAMGGPGRAGQARPRPRTCSAPATPPASATIAA